MVSINNVEGDLVGLWGGLKQSGIGREWGVCGIEEYLELKFLPDWFAEWAKPGNCCLPENVFQCSGLPFDA